MDGAGFEPASSAMPTNRRCWEPFRTPLTNLRFTELKVNARVLDEFKDFLEVNLRLTPTSVSTNIQIARRYLEHASYMVSYQSIAEYLKLYVNNPPKTYNRQIVVLRHFIRDFLGHPELIASFKVAPVDEMSNTEVPSKAQVRKGFKAQRSTRAKAIYLFAATSGLRKSEILDLAKDKVDTKTRAVIPQHFTRKKRSGVTFYNEEAEEWLRRYCEKRNGDDDPRVFVISDRQWRRIWRDASRASGTKITAQVLRAWFSTELGELGVPDRYVDVFCGRAPRSVLAKHYTGKGLERLKRIYDKANLKVLA